MGSTACGCIPKDLKVSNKIKNKFPKTSGSMDRFCSAISITGLDIFFYFVGWGAT
jgi:hypothetical protein